jgi:RND family efflux transporter MFP subunit
MVREVLLPCLAAAVIVAVGCSGEPRDAGESSRPITVAEVEPYEVMDSKCFSGVIYEHDLVKLSFRVAGMVEEIPVDEGRFARKGDLLARLDPRDYQLQYDAVKAEHDKVIAEVKRYRELYARNNITESEYEKAIAGETQIRAKFRSAENALRDTRLTAPFDGYVQALYVSEQEMVDAGTLIVSLVDVSTLVVETNVPPAFYLLRDRFESFSFTSTHCPGRSYPLELIGMTAKADTGNLYRIRLRYRPEPGCLLAPGMSVRVRIRYRRDYHAPVCIPVTAVAAGEDDRFVWLYRDGRVTKQPVETGMVNPDGTVEILEGLSPGDVIVTAGIHGLADGQAVRTAR